MNKLLYNLAKVIMIILVGVVIWKCSNHSENKTLPATTSVSEYNRQCYEDCREDLLAITCLVEGFHEKPYHCGVRWTVGYGSTIYPDGKRVSKKDTPISKAYAKACVYSHYDLNVWPWIEKYVTRKLTREQMKGTCSFIYNVGGETFSGHTKDGKVLQKPKKVTVTTKNKKGKKVTKTKTIWVDVEPSSFLLAINAGKDDFETAICMNGYRSVTIKGKRRLASGLPKGIGLREPYTKVLSRPRISSILNPKGSMRKIKALIYLSTIKTAVTLTGHTIIVRKKSESS